MKPHSQVGSIQAHHDLVREAERVKVKVLSIPERARFRNAKLPVYPKLGALCALISTIIALLLLPDDINPEGALFLPALILSIGLLIAPAVSCLATPRALLRAENLIAISPIYWLLLDLIQGAYSMEYVSHASVETAFITIGLFVVGMWVANFVTAWPVPKAVKRAASFKVNETNLFLLILIFFTLGFIRFAYPANFDLAVMANSVLRPRWEAPWSREQLGGWDAFLDHMVYFGYLLPTLTALLGHKCGWLSRKTIVACLITVIMLLLLIQGGGRRIVGVVVGAAIICWFLEQALIRTKHILVVGVCLLLLLITMQFMLEYRDVGLGASFTEEAKEIQYSHIHVDDNFLRLSQIIEVVPQSHPYVYEKQIFFIFIRPIPRIVWQGKPIDPGFDLSNILGERGVSLSASAIGDLYLAFGLPAVFIGGLFFGRLAGMTSELLLPLPGSARTLVYSLAAMTLVAGMRSLLELVLMSYMLLAWIAISNITLIKRIRAALNQ